MRSLSSLLRAFFAPRTRTRPIRQRYRIAVDLLEDRTVPALVINDAANFSVIANAADNVVITANGATGKIQVNGVDQTTDAADVNSLTINCQGNFVNVVALGGVTEDAFPALNNVFVDTGAGADNIVGTQLLPGSFQQLNGGADNDIIQGGSGNENINGGDGVDQIFGFGGNDNINGGRGNDIINGGEDDDNIVWNPGDGDDTIDGGGGQDTNTFNGASGPEDISVSSSGAQQRIQRTAPTAVTLLITNNESLIVNGGGGDDILRVGAFNDASGLTALNINGGDGTNTLFGPSAATVYNFGGTGSGSFRTPGNAFSLTGGFSGIQNLNAGNFNDIVRLGGGRISGRISGGGGINTLSYQGDGDGVFVNLNTGKATNTLGISGFRNVIGGFGDDLIFGNRLANKLNGGGGDDFIDGSTGNDSILGGDGDDELRGGSGNDSIFGGGGDDKIRGDAGNDILHGGSDDDEINGGVGNDRLFGGLGGDTLTDTSGNNVFVSAPLGEDILIGRFTVNRPRG